MKIEIITFSYRCHTFYNRRENWWNPTGSDTLSFNTLLNICVTSSIAVFYVSPLSIGTSHSTVTWFCVTLSTAFFYSSSTVCQYLPQNLMVVMCHCVPCCLLYSVQCLCSTVTWFCVTVWTALFYSLFNVCQYLTKYSLLVLCQCVHCFLLKSVSNLHSTVCCFCVTMSTATFYSLSTVCQYHTLYPLLVPCHHVHRYLLHSVHWLSVRHTVPYVGSVSLCPLLSSRVLHWLSVRHTLPSLGSVSLCPLLCSTVCPLPVSTSHCTLLWLCFTMSTAGFYSLSTVGHYFTLYRLLV
jgi:hypothetical protein